MYKLYNQDCTEILKNMETESIDLIITDPPYGINYKSGHIKNKNKVGDNSVTNNDDLNFYQVLDGCLEQCSRLLKEGGALYLFCSFHNLNQFITLTQKYFQYKNILVWVKNNWTAGDLKGNYGTRTEYIIYATKGRHLLNGRRDNNVLEYKRVPSSQQFYKFQKPVDLLEFLISKSSNENDMVLDPFCGSGSTIVASQNLGRNSIGIEVNSEVYSVLLNRLLKVAS